VEHDDHSAAAAATVDHDGHAGLLDDLMARIAPYFARREMRLTLSLPRAAAMITFAVTTRRARRGKVMMAGTVARSSCTS
jgi:hypothetical protein